MCLYKTTCITRNVFSFVVKNGKTFHSLSRRRTNFQKPFLFYAQVIAKAAASEPIVVEVGLITRGMWERRMTADRSSAVTSEQHTPGTAVPVKYNTISLKCKINNKN